MRYIYFFLFSLLSITQGFAVEENKDAKYFAALQYLDKAYEAAQGIKEKHVKSSMLEHLELCKKSFQKDFITKDFAHMANRAMCLNENVGEILADSNQDDLRMAISAYINDMAEQFQK